MYYVNPRRCARGAVPTFTTVNTGEAALFNNGSGAQVIRVWMVIGSAKSSNDYGITYLQGRLTTQNVGTINPVVSGDPVPIGLLDRDDVATPLVPDFYLAFPAQIPIGMGNQYPLAVLNPGWSLVAIQLSGPNPFDCSFFWDWCYPDELIQPFIGAPAIDKASRP